MSQPNSSSKPARRGKRPSRVFQSDSEDENSPSTVKRIKRSRISSSADMGESEEDGLESQTQDGLGSLSQNLGMLTPGRRDKGKGRASNGHSHTYPNGHAGDGESEEEATGQGRNPTYRREYDRDIDGFVAGSVVRIKMRGFMTYDHVEFRPGPHLNMILGPNGTGKSTIAAAIAIGLGFPPKVMGRANDLKSYVKQGTERAETEIELKARRGKRNVIIKRHFSREDDKSEWFLNGAPTTKKAITDVVLSLGIQANNLCSFLPQDKVAEFAAMAPVTVLRETMRAAGDPRLSAWHESLIEKGTKAKLLETNLESDIAKRDNHQATVDRMEPDVQHFRARAGQEFEREVLKVLVRVAERNVIHTKFNEYSEQRKALKKQIKGLKERNKPLLELAERQDQLRQKADLKVTTADDEYKQLPQSWRNATRRINDATKDAEDVDNKLQTLKDEMRRRELKKDSLRRKMREAQGILDQPRNDLTRDIQAKQQELRAASRHTIDLDEERRKVEQEYGASESELKALTMDMETKSQKMKQISVIETKRENEARDLDGSIAYLLDWLEANPMKLEGKVHKPPMISVNIRDPRYAWQVEACTNLNQRKTFICESRRDYDLLVKLNKTRYPARRRVSGTTSDNTMLPAGEVRLSLALVEVTDASVNPRRPCTPEHLTRLGFDGFAIDFVDADPAVISFLNSKCNMHNAALTQKSGGDINSDAVIAAGIRAWMTATDINRGLQSNYGTRAFQITSTGPVQARAFAITIDQNEVKRIEGEIAHVKRTLRDYEQPHAKLKDKLKDLGQKTISAKQTESALDKEARELRERAGRFTRAQHELDTAKKELQGMDRGLSAEQQRETLRAQKLEKVRKLVNPVHDHTTTTDSALEICNASIVHGLAVLQSQVNQDAIQNHLQESNEELQTLEQNITEVTQKIDEFRSQHVQIMRTVSRMIEGSSPPFVNAVKERMDTVGTPEEVAAQLAGVENDLELSAGVDPNFIARYDRIKNELEICIEAVKKKEKDLTILKKQINKILSEFDPALDALVEVVSSKFSAAFERVGCSGEVKINRVEGDFAAWGINILVSYRDGEGLSVLTQSRQSGGERSLATVTYLMSLSEMARTPFSLVDEINQGMDQKAERNVHNQLVEVTCGTDAGQYFLITPKLLTGLKYHEKMKVLIINNGTWIPDTTDKSQKFGDLKSCLARYVAAH